MAVPIILKGLLRGAKVLRKLVPRLWRGAKRILRPRPGKAGVAGRTPTRTFSRMKKLWLKGYAVGRRKFRRLKSSLSKSKVVGVTTKLAKSPAARRVGGTLASIGAWLGIDWLIDAASDPDNNLTFDNLSDDQQLELVSGMDDLVESYLLDNFSASHSEQETVVLSMLFALAGCRDDALALSSETSDPDDDDANDVSYDIRQFADVVASALPFSCIPMLVAFQVFCQDIWPAMNIVSKKRVYKKAIESSLCADSDMEKDAVDELCDIMADLHFSDDGSFQSTTEVVLLFTILY